MLFAAAKPNKASHVQTWRITKPLSRTCPSHFISTQTKQVIRTPRHCLSLADAQASTSCRACGRQGWARCTAGSWQTLSQCALGRGRGDRARASCLSTLTSTASGSAPPPAPRRFPPPPARCGAWPTSTCASAACLAPIGCSPPVPVLHAWHPSSYAGPLALATSEQVEASEAGPASFTRLFH